jgi:hypothetical protein
MGRAAACLAVLILAGTFLFVPAASESLTAEQSARASHNPPVHCCKQEEAVARQDTTGDVADLASAEERGQKPESHRGKKRNIDDDDDDDDGHNDDGDDDDDDDGNDGHDDNGGSETDHYSDSDSAASAHGSHSDHDPNNHHGGNSKSGKKKSSAPGRKEVQGGNR